MKIVLNFINFIKKTRIFILYFKLVNAHFSMFFVRNVSLLSVKQHIIFNKQLML